MDRLREADLRDRTVVVIRAVVSRQEDVADDVRALHSAAHVQPHEAGNTLAFIARAHLENVLLGRERVLDTGEVEDDVGKAAHVRALVPDALAHHRLAAEDGEDVLDFGARSGDERCAGVDDGHAGLVEEQRVAECDVLHRDDPVRLQDDVVVHDVASEACLVHAAEREHAAELGLGVLGHPERELRLLEHPAVDGVDPPRGRAVDGDGLEREPEDAVELPGVERRALLLRDLGEVLVGDAEPGALGDVVGHVAGGRARAVLDVEDGAVCLVRRRLGRVVAVVLLAGAGLALGRRDPQVGRAGVEDDGELLCGRADGDRTEELRVLHLLQVHVADVAARGAHGVELLDLLGKGLVGVRLAQPDAGGCCRDDSDKAECC